MFHRADLQFYAMTLFLAIVLHTCDWAVDQTFASWAEKYNRKEVIPVSLNYTAVSNKGQFPREISDTTREQRCKRSRECSKMAEALVYEARGESMLGAVAVAYVIVERTQNPERWPKTVRGVVAQKNQFSYTTRRQKVKPKPEDWERAYIASYQVLHGEVENPIGKSDHYHTLKVKPKWTKKMQYVATVGKHKFYRDLR